MTELCDVIELDAVSGVWFGRLETPIPWCDWLNQTKCPPPTHIVCTVHIVSTNPLNTTMTNVKQKRIWAEIYISPANQMQIFRSLSEIFKSSRFRPKKFRHSCYFSSALRFPSVRLLLLQPWAVCLSLQRLTMCLKTNLIQRKAYFKRKRKYEK